MLVILCGQGWELKDSRGAQTYGDFIFHVIYLRSPRSFWQWEGKSNHSEYVLNILFFFFSYVGLHLLHMEVPRLGVKSEVQLQAYTTATAMGDPSRICNLCCTLQQGGIPNPLSEVRDWTHIFMDSSWILNPLSHNGNSQNILFLMRLSLKGSYFTRA